MKGDSYANSSKSLYFNKYNPFFVKLVLLFLFLGLAIRFISSPSFDYSFSDLNSQPSSPIDTHQSTLISSNNGENTSSSIEHKTKPTCDLFKGEWVPNPTGPMYNNTSCSFIESHQNCMLNGRPDSGYLYWRWNPFDCRLPMFKPERFLHLMRNKTWAFIGDSISRNHVQSLICILSKVTPVEEIYHDEQFKSKTWSFPSYNVTISVIWTPFLIKADIFEDNNGVSTSEIQLHLDKIDKKWTSQYNSFNYVVLALGKWYLKTAIYYENNTIQGCHYCPGKNLTELGIDYAYRKALRLIFNFVTTSSHKALVFFRTITPDHFENGEWHNGGTCDRTVPFKEGQKNTSDVDMLLHQIELEEFNKTVNVGPGNGSGLKLFDTTSLSLLRPDGHPGPYRQPNPFAKGKDVKIQYDCLHWCLPGPIDAWNDLMMEMLMYS